MQIFSLKLFLLNFQCFTISVIHFFGIARSITECIIVVNAFVIHQFFVFGLINRLIRVYRVVMHSVCVRKNASDCKNLFGTIGQNEHFLTADLQHIIR